VSPRIVIIDYDCGNLFSLQGALSELKVPSIITRDVDEIKKADKIILPGVGAFGDGIGHIHEFGLFDVLLKAASSGKPMLGICLGMQLLMRESFEFGHHQGFGFIDGTVTRLSEQNSQGGVVKVPHIGWNAVNFPQSEETRSTYLKKIPPGTYVYFLHSFFVTPDNPKYAVGITEYGENKFCSIIQKENILGFQFHPEISGPMGLKLLENFVKHDI